MKFDAVKLNLKKSICIWFTCLKKFFFLLNIIGNIMTISNFRKEFITKIKTNIVI